MAKTLQLRRGTTSEVGAITGAVGELFVDLDKTTVVVMDGESQGGVALATEDSPALSGTPTAPTAAAGTNTTQLATTAFVTTAVTTAVTNLIDSSPSALDTLNELAAALGDDANFATTVTNSLATKAPLASPTFTGTVTMQQSTEILNTKSGATGTVVHDFSTGAIWLHSTPAANFTANFTNVPTTSDRGIAVTLIIQQGATGYFPDAVQIDGASQPIKWLGSETPTPTADRVELVSFTLIRSGSTWLVLGNLTSFG